MKFSRDLEIGFELEFGHDCSLWDIEKRIKDRIGGHKFVKKYYGQSTRHTFQFVTDETICCARRKEETELITPVWTAKTAIKNLGIILEILEECGVETNRTTGIHVNMGWKNPKKIDKMQPIAVVAYSNERKWLEEFNRANNKFCRGYEKRLKLIAKRNVDVDEFLNELNECIFFSDDSKNRFVNFFKQYDGYIEFRGLGGTNYHKRFPEIANAIQDFANAMEKSIKPLDSSFDKQLSNYLELGHGKKRAKKKYTNRHRSRKTGNQ